MYAIRSYYGIKKALEDSDCKYIICLNNDIYAEPEFLDKLIKCAEKNPEAGSIQSKMIWGHYPERNNFV